MSQLSAPVRLDPDALPALDSDYALSRDQIDRYQADGHVLLRGFAAPNEVAPYRDVIAVHTAEHAESYAPLAERTTYGKAFVQFTNAWERDDAVRRFVFARRFAKAAADLMGVEGVRLYHDQALFKEPGGGRTPWHQDQPYWPLGAYRCVTMWMPLVDATAEMGTLRFASGSQNLGYTGRLGISDESEDRLGGVVRQMRYPVVEAGAMRAGDATFHAGYVVHGAAGNASADATREVMTVIYVEDGARVCPPDTPQRENDMARWLRGLGPGDAAAGPLNPLLYHRSESP